MSTATRRYLDLSTVLVRRDLRVAYGNAALGIVWAPLQAIVQVAVLSFLFVRVVPLDIPDYVAFAYAGIAMWQLLSASLLQSVESFTVNRDLVRRPGFPTAVLPAVSVANAVTGYLLGLPVLVVLIASTGRLTASTLALPLVVAAAVAVIAGPAIAVATLHVRFRDVRHAVSALVGVLFFLTPVFYDVDDVPDRFRWIVDANPLALVVRLHRQVLYDGELPDVVHLATCFAVGAVGIAIGAGIFRRAASHLADDL